MAILSQDFNRIQVGDTITFKVTAAVWNGRKVTRKVIETYHDEKDNYNLVAVPNYVGCKKFYVRKEEILSVVPAVV